MNSERKSALPLLALALAAFTTAAGSLATPLAAKADEKAMAAAPEAGFTTDVAANLDRAEDEIVQLGEAVPAEKWSWRPGEGVRSYAEVTLHIAGGNYLLAKMLGTAPPDGIDSRTIDTATTDKAKAIEMLKASYVHVKKVIAALSASDLESKVDFFGRSMTKRAIVLAIVGHSHEHLGQSIAYARMNGVVPPWSK